MELRRLIHTYRFLMIMIGALCFLLVIYKMCTTPILTIYLLGVEYVKRDTEFDSSTFLIPENNSGSSMFNETHSGSDKWIHVYEDAYIYSAYWETRIKPSFVRIVGIGLNRGGQNLLHLSCAFKYSDARVRTGGRVEYRIMTENHGQRHTATFYICLANTAPLQVALRVKNQKVLKWLDVKGIEPNEASNRKMAICVQPLYGSFIDNNLHVAEFISYYQLLNVTHFTFYDYKAGPSVISLLTEISKGGVSIELLKWNLPDAVKDTWTNGQIASIVDCMYRQSQKYQYVFIVDLDEFLVPHSKVTLQNLIENIDPDSMWDSYMFRQSVFYLEQPDDFDPLATDIKLFTLNKVRHHRVWDYFARTKSIVRPYAIEEPGIHYIHSAIQHSSKAIMKVDHDIALLHHYRSSLDDDKNCSNNQMDKSAVKYGLRILNSVPIQIWERWNRSADI